MASLVGEELLRNNILIMNSLEGFDVVIVCCSSQLQADYWQDRLESVRGSVLPKSSVVLAVQEDWPGGAGNALGTLYAFINASRLAKEKFGLDIDTQLSEGRISIGLYHTAGKGTRLAPLPGAENNNKPGVKLPGSVQLSDGRSARITILESVIKQTGCYAKSRLGRLSVFWGDQVFVPNVPVEYVSAFHVDILCSLGPMMSAEDWSAKGMDKYGLIAQNATGGAAQVEKVSHATAVNLLAGLGEITSVGVSLGSFSVSFNMLNALLVEFNQELAARSGKLDSDPHLWMPMTLDRAAYLQLMGQKGVSEEFSSQHYTRIQSMLSKFFADEGNRGYALFGAVDVGQDICWWDYGQLKLYQKFALMPTQRNNEAALMRLFFGFSDNLVSTSATFEAAVDANSCIADSEIESKTVGESNIQSSIVCGVRTLKLNAESAILINVTARSITAAPGSIIYNIVDTSPEGITAGPGEVLAGVFDAEGRQEILRSGLATDGGKAWETVLTGNDHSFEQIYDKNATVCPRALEFVIAATHATAFATIHGL